MESSSIYLVSEVKSVICFVITDSYMHLSMKGLEILKYAPFSKKDILSTDNEHVHDFLPMANSGGGYGVYGAGTDNLINCSRGFCHL